MPMATMSVTFLFLTLWSDQMLLDQWAYFFYKILFEHHSALLTSEHPLDIGLFVHFLKTHMQWDLNLNWCLDTIKI